MMQPGRRGGAVGHDGAAPTRAHLLDLAFLLGVLAKGIDGLIELVAGAILLWVSPGQLATAAQRVTAHELREDPHDLIANLLVHGVAHLDSRTTAFIAAYLLVHGVVKLGIVAALMLGSLRVYPWAIAALAGFLLFQVYELFVLPGVGLALLTVLDALIVWLTWREWRRGRTVRDAFARTRAWVRRRRVD